MTALHIVVMGVAGCGKSAVGQRIANQLGLPLIEGDEFHPAANIEKMRQGIALGDDDRAGWLAQLGRELARRPGGAVLTCSALKRSYRDRLRQASAGLRFVHLALSQQQALDRVARRGGHFYPPSLVASQFAALEDPAREPGVLVLDACLPLEQVTQQAVGGLRAMGDFPSAAA
jgi:gluconokinase